MKKRFEIIEEDGVVIYDESDDYISDEEESEEFSENEDGEFRLLSNEEIFTDEYMRDYANRMEEKIAREKRKQRMISVGVVVAIILFIGFVSYITSKIFYSSFFLTT